MNPNRFVFQNPFPSLADLGASPALLPPVVVDFTAFAPHYVIAAPVQDSCVEMMHELHRELPMPIRRSYTRDPQHERRLIVRLADYGRILVITADATTDRHTVMILDAGLLRMRFENVPRAALADVAGAPCCNGDCPDGIFNSPTVPASDGPMVFASDRDEFDVVGL